MHAELLQSCDTHTCCMLMFDIDSGVHAHMLFSVLDDVYYDVMCCDMMVCNMHTCCLSLCWLMCVFVFVMIDHMHYT